MEVKRRSSYRLKLLVLRVPYHVYLVFVPTITYKAKRRLLAAEGGPRSVEFSSVYLLLFFRALFEHIVHHGSYLLCLQVSQSSLKEKRIYLFTGKLILWYFPLTVRPNY